jgi:hypothetical protein
MNRFGSLTAFCALLSDGGHPVRRRDPRHANRSDFTRDFEHLVAWLATRTDKTTITRMLRIHWRTVGRIVQRVCSDELDPDRLDGLVAIGCETVCA